MTNILDFKYILDAELSGLENNAIDAVVQLKASADRNDPSTFAESLVAFDVSCDAVNERADPYNTSFLARRLTDEFLGANEKDCAYEAAYEASKHIDANCLTLKRVGSAIESASVPKYHDAGHYLCVAAASATAALADIAHNPQTRLTKDDVRDLYVVGLLHDVLHRGGNNRENPSVYHLYQFEQPTWDFSEKILAKAGYEGDRLQRMRKIILSTDPECGAPLAEMAMRYHYGDRNASAAADKHVDDMSKQLTTEKEKTQLKELRESLFADQKSAEMSCFLARSDIALSTLSFESYRKSTQEFDKELNEAGKPIGLIKDGKINVNGANYFFTRIAGLTEPCAQPTLEKYFRVPGKATMDIVLDPSNERRLEVGSVVVPKGPPFSCQVAPRTPAPM